MIDPVPISLLVHTRNSAGTLPRLIASTGWIDERIAIDMQSTDDTAAICRAAGFEVVSILEAPAVDPVRNEHLHRATSEWTLVLDADEYLADDAADELARLIAEHGDRYDAFALPRYNSIAGQTMRGSLFYPDQQIRLFRKGHVRWHAGHHRPPEVLGGRLMVLEPPCVHIHHLNYPDLEAFISRQLRYALTDDYPSDPASFDFTRYLGEAYETFAKRHDTAADGDLSTALATVLAWDRVMRGLIHWERTGRTAPLSEAFSLPVVVAAPAGEPGGLLRRLARRLPPRLQRLFRRVKRKLDSLRSGRR
jgi:glycosyltransferase involved in cell wall biosynthesis